MDRFEVIKFVISKWTKPVSLLFFSILWFPLYYRFLFLPLKQFDFLFAHIWLPFVIFALVFFVWLITTKRLYFRNRWWSIGLFFLLSAISSLFPLVLYPQCVKDSVIDFPYCIHLGTVLSFLLLLTFLFLVERKFFNRNKMLIVFFVNNDKPVVESKVRDSIDIAINKVETEISNVEIIVPTFGICKKTKQCEKYIKRAVTRADAFIKADVMDGIDNGVVSYQFLDFTSRINTRRAFPVDVQSKNLNDIDETQKYQQWNFINIENDDCNRKIRIAHNLENTLLMYVASICGLKEDFDKAIPIVRRLYDKTSDCDAHFKKKANQILGNAYLLGALNVEHQQHNPDLANKRLEELVSYIPSVKNLPIYYESMARVKFLQGDLKASKSYNKLYGQNRNNPWGYELNCGFYAIFEGIIPEFIRRYKRLVKLLPGNLNQVEFAIEFLEYERGKAEDINYSIRLGYAIAFLYQFKNVNKAKRKLAVEKALHRNNPQIDSLKPLEDIVNSQEQTLKCGALGKNKN